MSVSHALEISADHAAYRGHFPNFPVLPGAVLLDEALQIIVDATGIDLHTWQIASAKFLSAVRPGDALRIEFQAVDARIIRFSIHAAERTVVTGTLAAAGTAAP
jgi:3-hydroxyacyl-[acyl-carrier-protein] dehydratase